MGSSKKAISAALMSLVMMLSFAYAIGVVPNQHGSDAAKAAAAGASAVQISADGASPAAESIVLEVGAAQSFSALGDAGLIPAGSASWSLASDGAAALSVADGDLVATLKGIAPGDAGLYVSTPDGGVDLVNVTVVDSKSAEKELSSIRFTNPRGNGLVFVDEGTTGIPLTLTTKVDDALDTIRVRYTYDGGSTGFGSFPPFPFTIPDVTALTTSTLQAAASSYIRYNAAGGVESFDTSATIDFVVEEINIPGTGFGYPSDLAALLRLMIERGATTAGSYIKDATVNGVGVRSVWYLFDDSFTKGLDPVEDGVVLSAADPDDETKIVSAELPAGLLADGEIGLALLRVSSSLEALVGAEGTDAIVTGQPVDGLADGATYAEISVFVSTDEGETIAEIDNARFADAPVTITAQGTQTLAGDNVNFFSFPTDVTFTPETSIDPAPAGAWTKAQAGTSVVNGAVVGEFTSLSVFAPFNTPNDINIVSVVNVGSTSLAGTAQDFAVGGSEIEVSVANATGEVLSVEVDGVDVTSTSTQATNGALEVLTFPAPEAAALASPAPNDAVSIAVTALAKGASGDSTDIAANALTYVGPVVDSVSPNVGLDTGGTNVTVDGEGFGTGMTASFGGAALTAISVTDSMTFTGTTTANAPGLVDVVVTTANNFTGGVEGAFTYEPSPPTITSVFPDLVYDDGGYTVRVTGSNFLDPETIFKGAAQTYSAYVYNQAFFTVVQDSANPVLDDMSPSVRFLDDTRLNVLTPVRATAGLYNIYVANAVYQQNKQLDDFFSVSNLADFEFLDIGTAPFSISSIVPDVGPKSGGTSVEITGVGFPEAKAADGSKGTTGFNGHTVRMINQAATNGSQVALELYYVRGDDLAESESGPASMSFRFSYDPAVLTPVLVSGQPANQESANLSNFYGKSIDTAAPAAGEVSVVISGGTTAISTCDDEIVDPFDPTAHDPTDCENPFLLGRVLFNVVGQDGDTSPLTLSQISMADPSATPLTGVNAANGQFCVGTEPCEIVEPSVAVDVFFGPNQATATKFVDKGTTASLTVAAPAAFASEDPLFADDELFPETGFGVDVMVQSQEDPTLVAFSKAASIYNPAPATGNRGFIYLNETPPMIGTFSPAGSWIFGGAVLTLNGQGFSEQKAVTVTIGGVEAQPAPGLPQTSTQRNVIVPPLVTDTTDRTITVDITVTVTADGKAVGTDTAEDAFTYLRYDILEETVGSTTATVATNAFFFEGGVGGAFDLVFNEGTPAKGNTNTISTEPGELVFPALPAEDVKGTSGTVFGILRASKNTGVIGTENLDQVGDAITNIWNFDLHIYDGQYPFAELTNIRYNTSETPITLSFPTNDTDLNEADLNTGGVSNWSIAGGLHDYTAGAPMYTPADGTPQFESTIVTPQATFEAKTGDRQVEALAEVKLYQATQAAFAVRRNAFPPADQIFAELGPDSAGTGPIGGGTTIEIEGQNIAWTNNVVFVPATKQGEATSVPANRGEDSELLTVETPPSPTGGQVTTDLFLDITTSGGKGGGATLIPVDGEFRYTGRGPGGILAALLGALLALVGLLAGGDSGGGGGGPCFIATAAYGTPMAEQIDTLRMVRDAYLLDNAVGSAFVDAYYRLSPAVADAVAQSPALAAAVRMVLVPVIALAKVALAMPYVSLGLMALALSMMAWRRKAGNKA